MENELAMSARFTSATAANGTLSPDSALARSAFPWDELPARTRPTCQTATIRQNKIAPNTSSVFRRIVMTYLEFVCTEFANWVFTIDVPTQTGNPIKNRSEERRVGKECR